jgi:hypothetical protein
VYDCDFQLITTLGLRESPRKLLYVKELDAIVISEDAGNIELMSVISWEITQSYNVFTECDILDIIKLSDTDNTYALALSTLKNGKRDGKL